MGGMWKKNRKHKMGEFLNRYSELSPIIYEYLRLFRIFVGPIDVKKRIRRRIEAAIANSLYIQSGIVGEFQNNDITFHPRRSDEEPFDVELKGVENILGLGNKITV